MFHEKDYDRILAISSREEEKIQLENAVIAQGNVEVWLGQLLNEAMSSLHAVIREASIAIESPSFDLLGNVLIANYSEAKHCTMYLLAKLPTTYRSSYQCKKL